LSILPYYPIFWKTSSLSHDLFLFLQLIEAKISPHIFKNHSNNSKIIGKVKKSFEKKTFFDEGFKIVRAMSLALSILILCYYGSTEYNILQNGQILRGFPSRKTIVIFSFGYSVSHSIIFAVAAGMLIYSIIMVNRIIIK